MRQNLEQTLIKKVKDAKAEVEELLFKEWKDNDDSQERDDLHAELRVLDRLIFRLIKSIRGNNDG